MTHFRDWLRSWLSREESQRMSSLMREVLDLRSALGAMKIAADQSYRDADRQHAELREQLAQLSRLLEPAAVLSRPARRVLVNDWDEVQRQNLRQFEEPAR